MLDYWNWHRLSHAYSTDVSIFRWSPPPMCICIYVCNMHYCTSKFDCLCEFSTFSHPLVSSLPLLICCLVYNYQATTTYIWGIHTDTYSRVSKYIHVVYKTRGWCLAFNVVSRRRRMRATNSSNYAVFILDIYICIYVHTYVFYFQKFTHCNRFHA